MFCFSNRFKNNQEVNGWWALEADIKVFSHSISFYFEIFNLIFFFFNNKKGLFPKDYVLLLDAKRPKCPFNAKGNYYFIIFIVVLNFKNILFSIFIKIVVHKFVPRDVSQLPLMPGMILCWIRIIFIKKKQNNFYKNILILILYFLFLQFVGDEIIVLELCDKVTGKQQQQKKNNKNNETITKFLFSFK